MDCKFPSDNISGPVENVANMLMKEREGENFCAIVLVWAHTQTSTVLETGF